MKYKEQKKNKTLGEYFEINNNQKHGYYKELLNRRLKSKDL